MEVHGSRLANPHGGAIEQSSVTKPKETLNKSLDALSKYETQTGGVDCANDIRDGQRIRGAR